MHWVRNWALTPPLLLCCMRLRQEARRRSSRSCPLDCGTQPAYLPGLPLSVVLQHQTESSPCKGLHLCGSISHELAPVAMPLFCAMPELTVCCWSTEPQCHRCHCPCASVTCRLGCLCSLRHSLHPVVRRQRLAEAGLASLLLGQEAAAALLIGMPWQLHETTQWHSPWTCAAS